MTIFHRKKYLANKRGLVIALAFGLLLGGPVNSYLRWSGNQFYATLESDRDHAQKELDEIQNNLNKMENEMASLEDQLSEKAVILSELLADQKILEEDMAQLQKEIDQAEIDLEEAKAQEAKSYADMILRIQYMYENSTQDSLWDAILNADGLTDLLNRVEYISEVHKADRVLLEDYKKVVEEVELLAAALEAQMNEMLAIQEIYEHQEIELTAAMEELKAESADYENQILVANKKASQLADYITEQNRLIEIKRQEEIRRQEEERKKKEEERKKKEEEERKKKEEEEKKKKEEEEKKKQEEEEKKKQEEANKNNSEQNNNQENNKQENNEETNKEEEKKPNTSGGYITDSTYNPDFTSDVTGEELVAYALKFVGYPYKWGGNSLTNGCDCSGFVNLIYRHFGFTNVPRQSQAFKSYGKPVAFENIKAGDIVVYPGHVAIYIGNGKIVEAQSSRAGITCTRDVTCSKITAIRRVL